MARAGAEALAPLADAWSVASNGLPPQLAGVEQQLFQAGLVPYLAYLWLLGQEDTRAPPLANFEKMHEFPMILQAFPLRGDAWK